MAETLNFSDIEKDAIAEVMNISMGNAATAISNLLGVKVSITTPTVVAKKAHDINRPSIGPAVAVAITYTKGISGTNLVVLKQDDVQLLLAQLMGQPLEIVPGFVFDELSISAVMEMMNQMMGASATALSDFLGMSVDISTPVPHVMEEIDIEKINGYDSNADVVAVNFDLDIEGVMDSQFVSVIDESFAKIIVSKAMEGMRSDEPETPKAEAAPASPQPQQQQPQAAAPQAQPGQQMPPQGMPMSPPGYDPSQQQYAQQQYNQQYAQQPPPNYQQPYGQMPPQYGGSQYAMPGMMPMQMPYGYPPPINIQSPSLSQFSAQTAPMNLEQMQSENLSLLMGVPLQVSVEIGKTKKKVKEILDFNQGTIIELERPAGSPVDVMVNGNLIARGDVVVIDDNFAIRITEILKSKFMDSLNGDK